MEKKIPSTVRWITQHCIFSIKAPLAIIRRGKFSTFFAIAQNEKNLMTFVLNFFVYSHHIVFRISPTEHGTIASPQHQHIGKKWFSGFPSLLLMMTFIPCFSAFSSFFNHSVSVCTWKVPEMRMWITRRSLVVGIEKTGK